MNGVKFITLWISILLFSGVVSGQALRDFEGRVVDAVTGEPLAAASIVAQNTTAGTLSDSAGAFNLRLPPGGYTLSITYSGYKPQDIIINNKNAVAPILIFMEAEATPLDEVQVVFDLELQDGWEDYGKFFKNNFLGETYFAKACIIKNPEVLRFFYFRNRKTLKVTASEPLIVDNYALGYTLTFKIDSFINNFNTSTSMFVGYPVFTEMEGTGEQHRTWKRNRSSIYQGSLLHFMRELYKKKLFETGYELKFIMKTPKEETPVTLPNPYNALNYQIDSEGTVHINPIPEEVAVIFHRETPEAAYLILKPTASKSFQVSTFIFDPTNPISIESNGYFYPQTEVITNGYLGFKKVADMLPYDYIP